MAKARYQGHLQTRAYRNAKIELAEQFHECHESGCTNRAITPDHNPPVSTFPDPSLWQGVLLPHCKYHADRQGAMMRWQRMIPKATREW